MKPEPHFATPQPAALRRLLWSLPLIVLVAFVIRMAIYFPQVSSTYQKVVVDFQYGAETGAVAAAIAQGRGFSSPLRMIQTGPTGWFAPIFPYLLGGIFKLYGVYSYKSNLVIHFFDIAFSAFTCWPVAAIGTRSFNKTTGIAAAWAWALLPTSIFFSVVWVWDTSLAALWFTMLVAATLQLRGSDRTSWWIGYGALWSIGAMINPSVLAVLPFLAAWAIWPLRRRCFPALRLATLSAVVFAAGLVPWTVRNYVVFHKLIALRSNFGLELWLGNNPDVPDSWTSWLHPNDNIDEARKYARMTEIPYMEEKSREAWAFMRSHPADTLRFSLHRFANNWLGVWDSPVDIWVTAPWYLRLLLVFSCGFALLSWVGMLLAYRSKSKAAPALAIVMLIFPLAFYLTHTSLRYRFPMDSIMLVLVVFAVQYAFSPSARGLDRENAIPADRTKPEDRGAEVPESVLA